MKTLKIGVMLLAFLLAAMAIVPMVSAANRSMPLVDWSNVKPTQPLSENDLITFVVSEKWLTPANDQKTSSITLNCSDFQVTNKISAQPGNSVVNLHKGLNTTQPIATLTLPKTMYAYFEQNSKDNSISVPRDLFKTYTTLNEFYAQQITLSNNRQTDTKIYTNKTPTAITSIQSDVAGTGYRYQKWDEYTSDSSGIGATYITGKITPSVYNPSPNGVYIFEEEEFHLNRYDSDGDGIDTIELVAAYDVSNTPSGAPNGINLFPVFYNGDINNDPIYTGYIHVSSAPHTYNFYLGIGTGSNSGKYEMWLQDTSTSQWLGDWYYQDSVNPSQYIRSPRVSSELTIMPGASGSFNDQTNPITDEHVMQGSTWYTPQQVFSFWRSVQNTPNLRFVSTSGQFQSGNLILRSYCSGSI